MQERAEHTLPQWGVESLEVKGLFGQFDYALPAKAAFRDIVIFYGDNGTGKTTLLEILFHLLSSKERGGHRTTLSKIPFRSLKVRVADGTLLTVERPAGDPMGVPLTFAITRPGAKRVAWRFYPGDSRERELAYLKGIASGELDEEFRLTLEDRVISAADLQALPASARQRLLRDLVQDQNRDEYHAELRALGLNVYFVSSDRQVRSDNVRNNEWSQLVGEGEKISARSHRDLIASVRAALAARTLDETFRWISSQAYRAANEGSESVNSIYGRVVRGLSGYVVSDIEVNTAQLVSRLQSIANTSSLYARYEFTSPLSATEMAADIDQAQPGQRQVIQEILTPYLDGLDARLAALKPIYETTSTFVQSVNKFYSRKKLHFSLTRGFSIVSDSGEKLELGQLSSGELQLLLLFCYTLNARERRTVIMIDEPEISLNVKWQRALISSLEQLSQRSNVQFFFASHSIDMISNHRDNVAHLNSPALADEP